MNKEIDTTILVQNIFYLCDKKGIKKSELERKIGVSIGYFSRLKNKDKCSIQVDVIQKLAATLETSINTLISVDLLEFNKDELLMIDAVKKLTEKAKDHTDKWERLKTSVISDYLDGKIQSNLPIIQDAATLLDHVKHEGRKKVYKSLPTGVILWQKVMDDKMEEMPWFSHDIDSKNQLLLTYMYSNSPVYVTGGEYVRVIELYLCSKRENHTTLSHLCSSSIDQGKVVEKVLDTLYDVVSSNTDDKKVINLDPKIKAVLDRYLEN